MTGNNSSYASHGIRLREIITWEKKYMITTNAARYNGSIFGLLWTNVFELLCTWVVVIYEMIVIING